MTAMLGTMATADSNKLIYRDRLLWIQRKDNGQWWPALKFEHQGQALLMLSSQLNAETKSRLTVEFLTQKQSVAHPLTTNDFIALSSEVKTLNFFDNVGVIYTEERPELVQVMSVVRQRLSQELDMPADEEPDASIKEDDMSEEEESGLSLEGDETWAEVWDKMRQNGWKKKTSRSGSRQYWVFPGCSRNGVKGEDFFTTLQDVQAYVKNEYGWNGDIKPAAVSKKRRREEDDGRIWGRDPSERAIIESSPVSTAVSAMSTPENQKTRPQDPGKPLLFDDEEDTSADEDPYHWDTLWPKLKRAGWVAINAARYNKLHNWYYIKPGGKDPQEGELGKDFFLKPDDVVDYIRQRDRQGGDEPAASALSFHASPRKRIRTRAPSQKAETAKPIAAKKKRKKHWWFHSEPLPSFKDVWNILQNKLEFKYASGMYKLPDGSCSFTSDLYMRLHLVKHGIPNVDRISGDDLTTVERWVKFAHVPVKDSNSINRLDGMQELSNEEASFMLEAELGFVGQRDGSYRRGDETFESLEDVRVYLRSAESLAPPSQGRRRHQQEVNLSDDQILQLRVWAALAPAPLPTIQADEEEESVGSDEESVDNDEEEAEEESATVITETTGMNTAGEDQVEATKVTASSAFDFPDDDSHDARRITMSPSRIPLMMTQPEA